MTPNPYKPTSDPRSDIRRGIPVRRRWAITGFLIVFLPFVSIGVYGLYADARYAATLPPNTARCGNGAMSAMLLIFPTSPILGCFGAGIGYIAAIVFGTAMCGTLRNDTPQDAE